MKIPTIAIALALLLSGCGGPTKEYVRVRPETHSKSGVTDIVRPELFQKSSARGIDKPVYTKSITGHFQYAGTLSAQD